jgi:hypothetical protein
MRPAQVCSGALVPHEIELISAKNLTEMLKKYKVENDSDAPERSMPPPPIPVNGKGKSRAATVSEEAEDEDAQGTPV